MHTLDEIRTAIRQLPVDQRWKVEACLRELDGSPIPDSQVREARPACAALDPSIMTFEEFFGFEQKSPLRHEFVNGAIFAMSGPTLIHNLIMQNLMFAIHAHLRRRRPCEVFSSGVRLVIRRETNTIAYCPDLIVDCRADTRDTYYLRDPKLIAEVLSPSTELIDRREKLLNYRMLDSLEEYVLISQDERRVVVYPRAERWKPRVYAGLDTAVELRSIDLTIPLIELYADVTSP